MAKLPKMEGEQPVAGRLKLNGLSATVDTPSHRDDTVFFIVEGKISEVSLKTEKVGPIRVEKADIVRHCVCDPAYAAARLNEAEEAAANEGDGEQARLTDE